MNSIAIDDAGQRADGDDTLQVRAAGMMSVSAAPKMASGHGDEVRHSLTTSSPVSENEESSYESDWSSASASSRIRASLDVVRDLVVAASLEAAIRHRQHERRDGHGDDNRGEHHRLRQGVGAGFDAASAPSSGGRPGGWRRR